jgi:hypothetical protein
MRTLCQRRVAQILPIWMRFDPLSVLGPFYQPARQGFSSPYLVNLNLRDHQRRPLMLRSSTRQYLCLSLCFDVIQGMYVMQI